MKGFLANWELKVLAVLSAVIFWFLVIGTENTFYTFPEEVPVKAFNLAGDLVVAEELPTVKLRLKIDNRDSIKNLSVDDFSAFIDLDGKKEGEATVSVEVSSKSSDIAVVKVEPSEITVKVEKMSEKEVAIDYKIEGSVADGYQVGEVEIAKENVIVKGAEDTLNNVYQATALITLDDNKEDLRTKVPLVAYDSNGQPMTDISFEEDEIEVLVPITTLKNQKILGVKPNVVGDPDSSVWIESIDVDPSYVVADGDIEALELIESASTEEVNVEGITENQTYTVSVTGLPEGVEVENNEITVTVNVKGYGEENPDLASKTIEVSLYVKKFKTVQRGNTLDPASVTLVVEGKQEDLDKISNSLRIDLDISGISQSGGTVNISPSDVSLPGGVKVVSLEPTTITVTWDQ